MDGQQAPSPVKARLDDTPKWLHIRSSPTFIVAAVSLSLFTDTFLYGIIVPVIPSALHNRAGVPYEDQEYWVSVLLACEAAACISGSPLFGYITDRSKSRQLPYLGGLLLLAASMIFLTVARSTSAYVVGRLLQGASTAVIEVAGLALTVDAVAADAFGEMMGYLGAANSLGFAFGPLAGGVVYHLAGYYAVFGVAFAIIALDLLLRVAIIEPRTAKRLKLKRSASQEALLGEESPTVAIESAERGHGESHAFFTLLKQPGIMIALWGVVVQASVIAAFDATLPLYVERVFGWDSLGAGLIFLPGIIPALFEPVYGWLADRYGVRIISFLSFLLQLPPLVCLRFVTSDTFEQKTLLCALLAFVGFFVDLGTPALLLEIEDVLQAVEREDPGIFGSKGAIAQSFGLYSMAYASGLLLGPLWAGPIVQRAGWGTMGWTLGLLAGITAWPMATLGEGWFPTTKNSWQENSVSEG